MGQYYHIVFGVKDPENNETKVVVNQRNVEGCGYIMAKLLEHSYIGNKLTSAVASYVWRKGPVRVMWVGDYAEEDELNELTGGAVHYQQVWPEEEEDGVLSYLPAKDFQYENKFLVNYSKREYLSYNKYLKKSKGKAAWGWTIDPLPLLTAVGNGRGGGDYREPNENYDLCGTWAWDELSITDTRPPKGYKERTDIAFS